ncbi:MAG: DUF1501 domain-containing protein [Planctomycetota bacterium]|nr:DUF1501 domain-containing protein [Planctomycetota bacterium]
MYQPNWHWVSGNSVQVHGFYATILHLMRLDPKQLAFRCGGRDYRLTDVHGRAAKPLQVCPNNLGGIRETNFSPAGHFTQVLVADNRYYHSELCCAGVFWRTGLSIWKRRLGRWIGNGLKCKRL